MASPAENLTENLAAAFERMAHTELLPDTVDVGRAVAEGRRAVRGRHTVGGAAIAGALVAVAALTWTAAAHGPGHASGPVAPLGTAAPSPTATPTIPDSSPNGPDPMTTQAAFGWLPAGMPISGYGTNVGVDWVNAGGGLGSAYTVVSTMVQLMTITADGPGPGPTTAPADPGDVVPGQTLNGRSVEFQPPAPACAGQVGMENLSWSSPSGQSVRLNHSFAQNPAPSLDVLMHIARTVTYGTRQIPLPVSVTGLAGAGHGLIIDSLGAFQPHEPNQITLGDDGMLVDIYYGLVTPSDLPGYGTASTQDASAIRTVGGTSVAVVIHNADGTSPPDTSKPGTAQQILDRVTYYGADQASWTTDVLRN